MLTLFKRIRKSLIESGSARQYLLYAIGEIALVVVGILIALQINNWNEERKNRKKEGFYLVELKNEFRDNREIARNGIAFHKAQIKNAHLILSTIVR